jgi:DMATS type aromatic prenyltransferase
MTNSEDIATLSESIDRSENSTVDTVSNLEQRISIDRQSQVGFDPERLVPTQTYVECGVEKLTALCQSVGLGEQTAQIIAVFRGMTSSWGNKQVGDNSGWQSDVSDDCAPFEFSLALDPDRVELRILIEAQGQETNLQSNWQAGLELNEYLAANYQVSLDRFNQIADLYTPTNAAAKFSMWHAVCFYPDKAPSFKVYLNPQSQSRSRSAAVIEESMLRLDFAHAWPTLAETAAQRGPDQDEFVYFSLDLAADSHARVKVYLRHHDATPTQLEAALSAARNYVSGDAIEFCQAMAPEQNTFSAKPAISAFSWVDGDNATPSTGTLHLPISNYTTDDRQVCDRLDLYFIQHGLPVSVYQSAIKSLAARPLETGVGMHSYTSLRREQQQRHVTLYLNPEVNIVKPPKTTIQTQPSSDLPNLTEIVAHYEQNSLADHPLLQRLQREPVNPQQIWLILKNLRELAIHFSRRLAHIIGTTQDERIRCLLTKQLNDELGNGKLDRIHRKLFEQMIDAINDWQIPSFTAEMLAAGKELNQGLEYIYLESDPYMAIGAGIVMEVYGEQFTEWLYHEFQKTTLDLATVPWLTLHEELEVEHVEESLAINRFVAESTEHAVAAQAGMKWSCVASWQFLNVLYRFCYTPTASI